MCYIKIPKNPGILFSKIPGSGLEVNPGIPGYPGIPLEPGGDLLSDGGDPRSIAGGSSKTTVAEKCSGAMEIQKYH